MDINLQTSISELPLVGSALTKAFSSMGIKTVRDVLYNFPTRYMDFRKTVKIAEAAEGETVTISGRVKSIRANHGFRTLMAYAEATVEDGTGKIKAVWFNQAYIAKQLAVGDEIILSGKVGLYKQLQLTNPAYEKFVEEGGNLHTGRLVPVYKRGDLVPLRTMRRIMRSCLDAASELDDFVPDELREHEKLLPIKDAVQFLHFPENDEQITAGRFRIAVDDVLPQQLAVQLRKHALAASKSYAIKTDVEKVKLFLKTLPFELTPSQKRAAWDAFQDLESGHPMNRLLQGDVGSGKTIVAILGALQTAGSGKQSAILAPTEILAKQHYETFGKILGSYSGIGLLTRTFAETDGKTVTKNELLNKIVTGEIKICIGTHALLQDKIKFKNLAFVVVDEQHRFGVSQRGWLLKAGKGKNYPHLLSMSATPIPRTLAMGLYADLAVSTLSQVPSGRKPVQTFIVPEEKRTAAYDFVRREAGEGRQAFIVTPRVEESEVKNNSEGLESTAEVKSVKKEFIRLQKEAFPDLRLGLLYGKMKGVEKDKMMADFAAGKLDVLVCTSVIEIGIDIPNATTMIIEGAERFGLAQLHQLRGRVGRNSFESKCFLFTTESSHQETARLTALTKSNDGFALAELDLKQRGFGDLFGKQQSGFLFSYPQFITVQALLTGKAIAENLVKLKSTEISRELKEKAEQYLEEMHNE